jgi:hypothetical protein
MNATHPNKTMYCQSVARLTAFINEETNNMDNVTQLHATACIQWVDVYRIKNEVAEEKKNTNQHFFSVYNNPEFAKTLGVTMEELLNRRKENYQTYRDLTFHHSELDKTCSSLLTLSLWYAHRVLLTKTIREEMASRLVVRKKGAISLTKVNRRLPNDLMPYIAEFLPYSLQFHLLEKRYNPIRLLRHLQKSARVALYNKLCQTEGVLSSMDTYTAGMYRKFVATPYYNQPMELHFTLLRLIYDMKETCPAHVIRLFKELIILIKPNGCKYRAPRIV